MMSQYEITILTSKDGETLGSVTLTGDSPLLLLNAAAGATHHALLAHPATGQRPDENAEA